jgi:hypothetical protein
MESREFGWLFLQAVVAELCCRQTACHALAGAARVERCALPHIHTSGGRCACGGHIVFGWSGLTGSNGPGVVFRSGPAGGVCWPVVWLLPGLS